MAKVNSPLYSISASGKIAERLVFSNRSSGSQARFQKAQKNINTSARVIERDRYSASVQSWNELVSFERDIYNDRAKILNMSGYNLFIKENIAVVSGLDGSFELGFSFLGLA